MKLPLIALGLAFAALLAFPALADAPLPYPDAVAPNPMPALSPGPDSDCGGVISLPPGPLHQGVWALGANVQGHFDPMLYFNTGKDARACRGSSGLLVRQWRRGVWR